MQLNDGTQISVGDLCFKGLNSNGLVEIGYGIKKEYEGQGYMTEAVTAMARWASEQIGVKIVEAETDPDNKASQRVLEKAGFHLNGMMGVEGPRFVFEKV
jgi:ribosomal-protein-alanine N-acetyltransferase